MSAEETVFSIPDLRLYILQYAIDDYEMERNDNCVVKCIKKTDTSIEACLYSIFCCISVCFCYRANISFIYVR